jgi:uncharacterized protein (DUF111 family)
MRLIYLDCFAGVSGNMLLGALLSVGLPQEELEADLQALNLPGWELRVRQETRKSIAGTLVEVVPTRHEHAHRRLRDIEELVRRAALPVAVLDTAMQVFTLIARAEGRVHGIPDTEVHFHEVGAVDSIVDVVGVVAGFYRLAPDTVWASPLHLGSGFVQTAHGRIPVPAPATAEILQGVPTYATDVVGELTTPTGAALVRVLARHFRPWPSMEVERIGYGLGSRDFTIPNALRLVVAKPASVERPATAVFSGVPSALRPSHRRLSMPGRLPAASQAHVHEHQVEGHPEHVHSSPEENAHPVGAQYGAPHVHEHQGERYSEHAHPEEHGAAAAPQVVHSSAGEEAAPQERHEPEQEEVSPLLRWPQLEHDRVLVLEANLDDMNPEWSEHVVSELFAAGAVDAFYTPVVMKRGRAGIKLTAICPEQAAAGCVETILRQSTSLGVRYYEAQRAKLSREWVTVAVADQQIRVKAGRLGAEIVNIAPEHEDCRQAALALGVPLKIVYDRAKAAAIAHLTQPPAPASPADS